MAGIIELCNEIKDFDYKTRMLSEEEALIFAQLAYLPYEKGLRDKEEGLVKEVFQNILNSEEPSISLGLSKAFDVKLMGLMKDSKRYGEILISDFVKVEDDEEICQFTGVTFHLDDGSKIISYRGTIGEVFAWKESLELAAKETIPSHDLGLKYLERIHGKTRGSLYIVGHSKGGNIAMYSYIKAEERIKDRVRKVYNFDGPGFNLQSGLKEDFKRAKDKIKSFIPQSSAVGILLNHEEEVVVIKSAAIKLFQHDPYSIVIERGKFIELDDLSREGKNLEFTMAKIQEELTREEVQAFIDTFFGILENEEKDQGAKNKLSIFFERVKGLNEEDRENINRVIKLYRKSYREAEELTRDQTFAGNLVKNINQGLDSLFKGIKKGPMEDGKIEESKNNLDETRDNNIK